MGDLGESLRRLPAVLCSALSTTLAEEGLNSAALRQMTQAVTAGFDMVR